MRTKVVQDIKYFKYLQLLQEKGSHNIEVSRNRTSQSGKDQKKPICNTLKLSCKKNQKQKITLEEAEK